MTEIFVTAFAIIWVLVWITAIVSIVRSRRKGILSKINGSSKSGAFKKPDASEYSAHNSDDFVFRMPGQPKRPVHKRTPSKSLIKDANGMLLEDRENDWLARQIREEDRIMRRGSELDAGAAHSKECQADSLKKSHLFEHDDSIDSAEY